jgi:DNA-binding beta-propeller fold protein YncE
VPLAPSLLSIIATAHVDVYRCCRGDVGRGLLCAREQATSGPPAAAGPPLSAATTWPLTSAGVRLLFVKAVCAVAEGADVPLSHTVPDASSPRCPPGVCVSAVLGDALRRVSVLGGREGMSRSLGSVYGGSVTRFLGGLRGVASRVIPTPGVKSECGGVAVSRDGCTLLAVGTWDRSNSIHVFSVADGSRRRVIGGRGDGPLQFNCPCQVWIAPDDFVFVADCVNNRVQVLTPSLDFHAFVGVGQLDGPAGVCANADVVVVSENNASRVSVFSRGDGTFLRQFGREGRGDGDSQLNCPSALCFMSGDRHVAIADTSNSRVSVFSVDGDFIRHVGVGVLGRPKGVFCSAFDELVVADKGNDRVVVFTASGEVAMTFGDGGFSGIALYRGCVFAQREESICTVFK